VSDGMKSATERLTLNIRQNVAPVWVTGDNVGEGLGGAYFSAALVATDANGTTPVYTIDENQPLPAGLSLASNGYVFGILPTATTENQIITFGAKASDGPHTISKTFTITALVNVNPVFTVPALIEAISEVPLTFPLTAADPLG